LLLEVVMDRGYIVLWRCIRDNHFWQDRPFDRCRAWIDLLMLANYSDGFIRVRGISVEVKRGQVGWSEISLAEKWGWSRGKVRRFLKDLAERQQIVQQNNKLTSLITITKYDLYQFSDTTGSTTDGQQTVQQTDNRQYTKKEVNKVKNIKTATPREKFIQPTIEEVSLYCQERKNSVDAESWMNHYQAKGWKIGDTPMKDWKAAVRTWEKRSFNNSTPQQQKRLF